MDFESEIWLAIDCCVSDIVENDNSKPLNSEEFRDTDREFDQLLSELAIA